jgi:hypothetical protein
MMLAAFFAAAAEDATYPTLTGWAAIISAIGVVIVGVLTLFVKRDSKQINNAVNHKAPEDPTLLQYVKSIHTDLREVRADVAALKEASHTHSGSTHDPELHLNDWK